MIPGYLVLAVALAAMSIWAQQDLRQFLAVHRDLNSSRALEDFKGLARRNMYAALVYAPLGLVGLGMGVWIVWTQGLAGLALVLAANVILWLMGRVTKRLETTARSLPCADAPLAEQYRQVSETWVHKPLPNF